ncbi:nuclear transport factor 2 family protein [Chitinophaga japonensis]|uniref:Uncharacterized protein DUF3471 n=1 Tax=Chitinophaga japonensis TaxID=104662 RepID=A0A562SZR6_CHIJA|nr:DUF4440 domain-containing protein [Chitinophaga japonensis]TWI86777.1 uncharacterized protein DUF3471 [Chitinophaga japonensis]
MQKIAVLLLLVLSCLCTPLSAQENGPQLSTTILHLDSLFWQAYNTCNLEKMADYFTEDVEFYHDKGGATFGLPALLAATKKGMCNSDGSFRLRREAVTGSVQVFPLMKNDAVYGAILSGEHVFYVLEKGKAERLDGKAAFTHLWLLQNGAWKMARVLSYDHGPAPYINKRQVVTLPDTMLQTYAGTYKGAQSGTVQIQVDNGSLTMLAGGHPFKLYAAKEGFFFSKERDLTFEFVKTGQAVTRLIVRERGEIAEELVAER